MTNGSTLLTENSQMFSPISHLHFEYYDDAAKTIAAMQQNEDLQCLISKETIEFGQAQNPGLFTYPDGVDVMQFLLTV